MEKILTLSPNFMLLVLLLLLLLLLLGPQLPASIHLGRRIHHYTGEDSSTSYLPERLSVAVQRGDASLIRDTLPLGPSY